MQIAITVNDKDGLAKLLDSFPEMKKAAVSRAINRTAEWARTRTVEILKPLLFVKRVSTIRDSISLSQSSPSRLRAVVTISPKHIALFQFHGKPTAGQTKHGISFQLSSTGGVSRIEHNAFVAVVGGVTNFFKRADTAFNFHVKVIAKTGKRAGKAIWTQNKINKLYGPNPTVLLERSDTFNNLVKVEVGERLQLQLDREVSFIVNGTSKISGGGES